MAETPVGVESSQTYTMRELNQRTAEVMREINDSGRPAAITRRGRFIALITPLASEQVESAALQAALNAAANRAQLTGEEPIDRAERLEDVAKHADVEWRGSNAQ